MKVIIRFNDNVLKEVVGRVVEVEEKEETYKEVKINGEVVHLKDERNHRKYSALLIEKYVFHPDSCIMDRNSCHYWPHGVKEYRHNGKSYELWPWPNLYWGMADDMVEIIEIEEKEKEDGVNP